jgi:hypothetical protein
MLIADFLTGTFKNPTNAPGFSPVNFTRFSNASFSNRGMAFGKTSFQYSSGRKEARWYPRLRVKYYAYIRPDGGFAK